MTPARHVQIFLEDGLLDSAQRRAHNFLDLMQDVLEEAGLTVEFLHENDQPQMCKGLSLVHMKPPLGRNGLTFRRVYHYPFWQIDKTEQRWAWDVARDHFDPAAVDTASTQKFQRFWRKRLYGTDAVTATPNGPIYIPLQGKLTEHRSFQVMSPVDMVKTTLQLDPKRDVIATLHPKERYTPAEHVALDKLQDANPRLTVTIRPPKDILPTCAYVVTENSAVAFDGFLFDKPAILFARIDFHHISQSLTRTSAEHAFDAVLSDRPDFAKYVHWFWQQKSINAGRDDAADKIRARFKALGWPI